MARGKLSYRVKASSILEVVIAMLVIIIISGIAMMIYTNVVRFSPAQKRVRAGAILTEAILNDEQNPHDIVTDFTENDITVKQEIKSYNGNTGLSIIILTAYDQNQQEIAKKQKIILTDP